MPDITKESFIETLDALLSANRHARSKGDDFKDWCFESFKLNARISHIKEQRQTTNRVSEQFRYEDPVVVFVCDEEVKREVISQYVIDREYKGLRNIALIGVTSKNIKGTIVNNYTFEKLIVFKTTAFSEWAETFFENVEEITSSKFSYAAELLDEENLIRKVRASFIKYWKTIDQHGPDFETYVHEFENAVSPFISKVDSSISNVFQIVDYKLYNQLISSIISQYPEIAYLEKERNNHGKYYQIASTHVHFRNYLSIIENSDFRANYEAQETYYNEVYQPLPYTLQSIFFGAPGVGKSHHLKSVYINEDDVIRTTFHPETDYASFVGCYKPQSEDNEIVYKFQGQAFTEAYVKAWERYVGNDERKDTFLVIEEINRGNCAQIFGDIFQLLDRNEHGFSDYSVIPDKDLQAYLHSQFEKVANEIKKINKSVADGTSMILPPNLHILATMNTSDQSLFPIDSAFKRRWDWVYMPIDTAPTDSTGEKIVRKIQTAQHSFDWGTFLKEVNARIYSTTLSEDKQLGFWFVKPKDKDGVISASDFVSKVIFFLWNDIYKDYADDSTSIFNFAEDGNPDSKEKSRHSFKEFTPKFQQVNNTLVDAFIKNLGIKGKPLTSPSHSENFTASDVPQSDSGDDQNSFVMPEF